MKKSIFVVVALMAAMVLSLGSCKSDENKSGDDSKSDAKGAKNAVENLKTACKDNKADDAKKYYKEALEAYAKAYIDALKKVKTEEDAKKADEEMSKIRKEVNETLEDCDCLKREDRRDIENELEKKYYKEIDEAMEAAVKNMRKVEKAAREEDYEDYEEDYEEDVAEADAEDWD